MKLPDWWTEMGWDFRLCVLFVVAYVPFMFWVTLR